jgi:hypothetical protein
LSQRVRSLWNRGETVLDVKFSQKKSLEIADAEAAVPCTRICVIKHDKPNHELQGL